MKMNNQNQEQNENVQQEDLINQGELFSNQLIVQKDGKMHWLQILEKRLEQTSSNVPYFWITRIL